ncbi:MAG: hypothetical protein K0M56_00955 [Kaistella sp.]|nr:hypothetical protein [Kaistella sp.]
MIDFTKFRNHKQEIINHLYDYSAYKLKIDKRGNHHYINYRDNDRSIYLQFYKILQNGKITFRHVDFSFSPHYISNNNLHNGNDFTTEQSIKTIKSVFDSIGIHEEELRYFDAVNLEYAINSITEGDIEDYINGTLYWGRKLFKRPNAQWPYYKVCGTTKQLKVYAKGLQSNFQDYGVEKNTIRTEVHLEKSNMIRPLGIYTVEDLLNSEKYSKLYQSLLNEWDKVLLLNLHVKNKRSKPEFWDKLITHPNRNKFSIEKERYYNDLSLNNNLHREIKCKIIDKLNTFSSCAKLPYTLPINTQKLETMESNDLQIKGINAHVLNAKFDLNYNMPHSLYSSPLLTTLR